MIFNENVEYQDKGTKTTNESIFKQQKLKFLNLKDFISLSIHVKSKSCKMKGF